MYVLSHVYPSHFQFSAMDKEKQGPPPPSYASHHQAQFDSSRSTSSPSPYPGSFSGADSTGQYNYNADGYYNGMHFTTYSIPLCLCSALM